MRMHAQAVSRGKLVLGWGKTFRHVGRVRACDQLRWKLVAGTFLTLGIVVLIPTNGVAQGRVNLNNHTIYSTQVFGPEPGNPSASLSGNTEADTPPGTQVYTGAPLQGTNWFAQLFSANGSNQ